MLTCKSLGIFGRRVQRRARGARDSGDGRVTNKGQKTSVGLRVRGVQSAGAGAGGKPWWEGVASCRIVGPGGGGQEEAAEE